MIFRIVSEFVKDYDIVCNVNVNFRSLAIVAGADCGLLKIAIWNQ